MARFATNIDSLMLLPADPSGDRWADLVPRMYEELRTLAHAHLRREQTGHTLGTTALVHEAWLRLVPQSARSSGDAGEFFRVASTTMRNDLAKQRPLRR